MGHRGAFRRSRADPEAFRRATDERTRAYYAETLPNPKLHVFPIARSREPSARKLGVPLIVDNTAAPVICRPFDHGAHVIVYSTDEVHRRPRHLDRRRHRRFSGTLRLEEATPTASRLLNQPDPSYHGAVWTEAAEPLGPIAYILKARVTLQRDLGYAAFSPFNAFLSSSRAWRPCLCGCASTAAMPRRWPSI